MSDSRFTYLEMVLFLVMMAILNHSSYLCTHDFYNQESKASHGNDCDLLLYNCYVLVTSTQELFPITPANAAQHWHLRELVLD
jgi:hypothetical protein